MKTIAVIFGGKSVEHDISIVTGLGVIKNMGVEYDIVPIYVDTDNNWWTGKNLESVEFCADVDVRKLKKCYLKPNDNKLYIKGISTRSKEIFCVVNCMHGGLGENGAISGVFRCSGIPESSSGVLGNAVCMDKFVSKMLMRGARIPTQKFMCLRISDWKQNNKELKREFCRKIGFPCILKPSNGGSSIGISVAKNWEELEVLLDKTRQYEDKIVIEKYLCDYREINISAFMLDNNIILSNTEEVIFNKNIFDYDSKYKKSTTVRRVSPAMLNNEILDKIAKLTKKAYKLFECAGVVRFDYFVINDKVYLNEVNTVPGSLAYYLWKNTGYTYARLINRMIVEGVKKYEQNKNVKISRDTKLLKELKDNDFKMNK